MTHFPQLVVLMTALLAIAAPEPSSTDHRDARIDRAVTLTINPEARISVTRDDRMAFPSTCKREVSFRVHVVNQGYVTERIVASLIDPAPKSVSVKFSAEPLKGIRNEYRILGVTLD